jgi:opacity protein-like surface antigen
MDMMKISLTVAALAVLLASPALAQSDDKRVRVSFGPGLTAGAVDGELALTASAGYRFAERVSFEAEFTWADEAADRFNNTLFPLTNGLDFTRSRTGNLPTTIPDIVRGGQIPDIIRGQLTPALISGFPIPIEGSSEGSTMLVSAGFRYEIPVQGNRFRPYLNAGIGFSRTEQEFSIGFASTGSGTVTIEPNRVTVTSSTSSSSRNEEIEQDFTHTGIMGTAGVGAGVRVFKELWIDLNARFYLMDRDRQMGTFGGGVSYRF